MKSILYTAVVIVIVLAGSVAHAETLVYHDGDVLREDTVWRGDVLVDGVLFVPEGVTLTISPGTQVSFTRSDAEYRESGVSEAVIPGSGIRVEGRVVAQGSEKGFITFRSAEKTPAPGAWGCIFFDHSKGSVFGYCRFEHSTYTLHAHFSSLDVKRCVITDNMDGSRLGYSKVSIEHCDITGNTGKGLNFANCRNTVRYCNITGNNEGIFLNQKDAACVIEDNNINGNTRFDLSLGEFHEEDISLSGNWWGTMDELAVGAKVYDKADDPEIGKANLWPAKRKIPNAGVDGLEVKLLWKFKTSGFVDSSPAVYGGRVYFGSWDKNFYCVDEMTGELVWKFGTGDCVDSSPAVYGGRVYFGSWDRNIYCLDAAAGRELWRFEMDPSSFDDHRQSSPTVAEGVLYMGGFNGGLYFLDEVTGLMNWEFMTDGPVRSRPLVLPEYVPVGDVPDTVPRMFVGSGDGYVYAISPERKSVVWKFQAGDRVTSSPSSLYTDVLFGGGDGRFYSVDRITGEENWSCRTGGRIEYSSPLAVGGLAIIGSTDGKVYAAEPEYGELVWTFDTMGVIYSSPQAVKRMVAAGNNDGAVYWLDRKTGSPRAVFHAGDAVQSLFAGPGGVLYAGSREGYLYALSIGK